MLQDDFYTIANSEVTANTIVCDIELNSGHDIYRGHFPGQPVMPGACMLQIVNEVLASLTGKPVKLSSAADIKFLQMVNPLETPALKLTIQFTQAGDMVNVNTSLQNNAAAVFKCRAAYTTH